MKECLISYSKQLLQRKSGVPEYIWYLTGITLFFLILFLVKILFFPVDVGRYQYQGSSYSHMIDTATGEVFRKNGINGERKTGHMLQWKGFILPIKNTVPEKEKTVGEKPDDISIIREKLKRRFHFKRILDAFLAN